MVREDGEEGWTPGLFTDKFDKNSYFPYFRISGVENSLFFLRFTWKQTSTKLQISINFHEKNDQREVSPLMNGNALAFNV